VADRAKAKAARATTSHVGVTKPNLTYEITVDVHVTAHAAAAGRQGKTWTIRISSGERGTQKSVSRIQLIVVV
jgi:hypothetical protein